MIWRNFSAKWDQFHDPLEGLESVKLQKRGEAAAEQGIMMIVEFHSYSGFFLVFTEAND